MDRFAKDMGEKIISIKETVDKMGEKKEEANMAQKKDKEAGELIDTKADAGE